MANFEAQWEQVNKSTDSLLHSVCAFLPFQFMFNKTFCSFYTLTTQWLYYIFFGEMLTGLIVNFHQNAV